MRKADFAELFSNMFDWIMTVVVILGLAALAFLFVYMIFYSFSSYEINTTNRDAATRYCYDHNYPRIERVQDDYYCLPEQGQPGEIIMVPNNE